MAAAKKTAPRSKKIVEAIEVVTARTIGDLITSLDETETQAVSGIADLKQALRDRRSELDRLCDAIGDRKAELAELDHAERHLLSLQELELSVEDLRREHERLMARLSQEQKDQIAAYARQRTLEQQSDAENHAQALRERKIAQEDEDRNRSLAFDARERELKQRELELEKRLQEAGDIDARIEKETEKRVFQVKQSAGFETRHLKTQHDAEMKIATANIARLTAEVTDLRARLERAEVVGREAVAAQAALARDTVTAASNKEALTRVTHLAEEHAKGAKR